MKFSSILVGLLGMAVSVPETYADTHSPSVAPTATATEPYTPTTLSPTVVVTDLPTMASDTQPPMLLPTAEQTSGPAGKGNGQGEGGNDDEKGGKGKSGNDDDDWKNGKGKGKGKEWRSH